jgi:hypothetical protein
LESIFVTLERRVTFRRGSDKHTTETPAQKSRETSLKGDRAPPVNHAQDARLGFTGAGDKAVVRELDLPI